MQFKNFGPYSIHNIIHVNWYKNKINKKIHALDITLETNLMTASHTIYDSSSLPQ